MQYIIGLHFVAEICGLMSLDLYFHTVPRSRFLFTDFCYIPVIVILTRFAFSSVAFTRDELILRRRHETPFGDNETPTWPHCLAWLEITP